MSVFTNHLVSEVPFNKLQLQYLSDERRSRMIEKCKNGSEISLHESKEVVLLMSIL
ncbi:hypothetical protein J1N35_037853 [Gossypium stocksii]|uniref:Uncharacterized protein n=1 Tax=Gossypium stocksii TaxID=47602 RepID=A0A9D3UMR8_9ROSI|nr:hypothetical protein J1N35_037853 [Gossypium stocksii]